MCEFRAVEEAVKNGSPSKHVKSEDGWWVLRGVVRLRLRSSKKGSLEERKEDTRTFTREPPLDGLESNFRTYLGALWKKDLPRI